MRRMIVWMLALMLGLLMASCITQPSETTGDLPWNTPPGWANRTLGLPY